jgi:hypothetical protein
MRFYHFASACLSYFLIAGSHASAQEFEAAIGQVAIGRCHADACNFFVIEDSKPVGSTKEGDLFALAAKGWENEYKAHGGNEVREHDKTPSRAGKHGTFVAFVFCSKTKPIEFFYRDGKWNADILRPGDDAAISAAEEYSYVFYWAACHGVISRDPLSAQLADRLGYRFKGHPAVDPPGTESHQIQPMDVLR